MPLYPLLWPCTEPCSRRFHKLLSKTFGTIKEVCKLVKKSPKRESHLKELRSLSENENRGVHAFCPTRWTIRGQSCQAMLENYDELMELWEWSLESVKETEMIARIRGVMVFMTKFKFLFGCLLGKMLLVQTDNLSRTLQDSECTAIEGQDVAEKTVQTLKSLRNDESFGSFWKLVRSEQARLGIEDPSLPRKRRRPRIIDNYFTTTATNTTYNPETTEEMHRKIYYEAIDNAVQTITARFDQPDWAVYRNMQQILINALNGQLYEDELNAVHGVFGDDINKTDLNAQLENLKLYATEPISNARELVEFLQSMTQGQKRFLPQVVVLAKLLLVMPASNAVSERSFSALKRVKTYLRATTTNRRLNHLMLLHIHKEKTDSLDLVDVANSFSWKDNRREIFGKFCENDIKPRAIYVNKFTQTTNN